MKRRRDGIRAQIGLRKPEKRREKGSFDFFLIFEIKLMKDFFCLLKFCEYVV